MTGATSRVGHNADWLPRDDDGRFLPGFRPCRECDGTGTVQELGELKEYEGDAPDYSDFEVVEVDCRRCDGRGAEHAEGCPRCGGEIRDCGVMPCSGRKLACYDCGWSEVVG